MTAQDWTILLLFTAGLGLFWLEMFLPGGLVGLAGFVALVAGITLTFQIHGPAVGALSSVAILVISVLLVRHWMKTFQRSYFGSRMTNREASGRNDFVEETRNLTGSCGVAISRLQPGGKGLFGDRQLDVVSQLGSIEAGAPIEIIRVEGIAIFVRPCGAEIED
jgi:membrane-bound ClpP family serine protease